MVSLPFVFLVICLPDLLLLVVEVSSSDLVEEALEVLVVRPVAGLDLEVAVLFPAVLPAEDDFWPVLLLVEVLLSSVLPVVVADFAPFPF